MERSKSKLNVNVYVFQAGGRDIETETTLQAIMDKATVFPTLVQSENAVPYSMLVHDYRELKLPGDGLTFADIQNQRDVLTFNAGLLAGFDAVVNDIDFIRKNLDDFKAADGTVADDQALGSMRRECLKQMDQIRLQMSKCSEDATACARIQSARKTSRGGCRESARQTGRLCLYSSGSRSSSGFSKSAGCLWQNERAVQRYTLLFRDEFADLGVRGESGRGRYASGTSKRRRVCHRTGSTGRNCGVERLDRDVEASNGRTGVRARREIRLTRHAGQVIRRLTRRCVPRWDVRGGPRPRPSLNVPDHDVRYASREVASPVPSSGQPRRAKATP